MSEIEIQDTQGNTYRIQRGFGHGYAAHNHLASGTALNASIALQDISPNVLYSAYQHFYFDLFSLQQSLETEGDPQFQRPWSVDYHTAICEALASGQLILTQIKTAAKVIEHDPRALLRVKIQQELNNIIAGERAEARRHANQINKEGDLTKALVYTGAFMHGLGTSAWGLAVQVKEISDVFNPVLRIYNHTQAIRTAWDTDNFSETYANEALKAEKRELVEALGFDPSKISMQQIDEAIAMTDLVLNDETLREQLYRFVKDYAEAQHAIEITRVAGSGAFELILTIIVAAVTGGAGVMAVVASKGRLVRQFTKVGDLLAEFAQTTKQLTQRKQKTKDLNNSGNTNPTSSRGELESVDADVSKTDAHGAEKGEFSQKSPVTPEKVKWSESGPNGLRVEDPRDFEVGKLMYEDLLANGRSPDLALTITRELLESGVAEPIPRKIPKGTTLYKVVPKNGGPPGENSPYFVTKETFDSLPQETSLAGDALGLPQVPKEFDVYTIKAKEDFTVYESTIAPFDVNSSEYLRRGGKTQTLVLNRDKFTSPSLVK